MASINGKKISQEEEEDIDIVDALFSEGTADYVDQNFFRRRNEVGAIIGNQFLPEHILHHLFKLKECYSLGLFEATIIYCRAVIELAAFETLKRRDKVKQGSKIADIREYSLSNLMQDIKLLFIDQTILRLRKLFEWPMIFYILNQIKSLSRKRRLLIPLKVFLL